MVADPLTVALESVPSLPGSCRQLERRYTDEQSEFLDLGDVRIHYRSEGNPDGQTLLLLHGTYSSLHTWEGWVAALGDNYHLVRLDMPGFGLTGQRERGEHTLDRLLETICTFCDERGLTDIVVAGNSLGGGVAWRLATRRPDHVSGLVLLDAGGSTLLCRIIDSLTTPLLFQWGSQDEWLPPAFGRNLADQIPDTEFIEYDGVGHVPMEEAPDRTAADARAFVDALGP